MSAREKLLKQGKINIIAFFNTLPQTEHNSKSFTMDVPFQSSALIVVVVNGICTDLPKRAPRQLRSFCRSFTIIPQGTGFVIINDQLMVSGATYQQKQKFASKNSFASPATSRSSQDGNQAMIDAFMQRTGMVPGFARQCLLEHGFDFNEALRVFEELNTRGAIPPEAFAR